MSWTSTEIIKCVNQMLNTASDLNILRYQFPKTSSDFNRAKILSQNLRIASNAWANDIFKRVRRHSPHTLSSQQKLNLKKTVLPAIQQTQEAYFLISSLPKNFFNTVEQIFLYYLDHANDVGNNIHNNPNTLSHLNLALCDAKEGEYHGIY